MRIPRATLAGLTVAAVMAVAGCGIGGDSPADAKKSLMATTAALKEGNYSFNLTGPKEKSTGQVHLPSRSAYLRSDTTDEDGTSTIQWRLVGQDNYVKMKIGDDTLGDPGDFAGDPELAEQMRKLQDMLSGKRWMHVDLSRVKDSKSPAMKAGDADLTGAAAAVATVLTVKSTSSGWTGTLDATKMPRDKQPWTTSEIAKAGNALKAVPFTATADDEGRLARLTLSVPAIGKTPAHERVFAFSGYGDAKAQTKPPADEVEEAPEATYAALD